MKFNRPSYTKIAVAVTVSAVAAVSGDLAFAAPGSTPVTVVNTSSAAIPVASAGTPVTFSLATPSTGYTVPSGFRLLVEDLGYNCQNLSSPILNLHLFWTDSSATYLFGANIPSVSVQFEQFIGNQLMHVWVPSGQTLFFASETQSDQTPQCNVSISGELFSAS
jgi:hypothetical protein